MKQVGPEQFFWDHVKASRSISPERRLLDCLDMYDLARTFTLAGIRNQHPDAGEDEIVRLLWERLKIAKHIEKPLREYTGNRQQSR